MNDKEKTQKIIGVVAENMGCDENNISLETKLEDINVDSLDEIEIVMGLENEFNVHIPDEIMNQQPPATINDLLVAVNKSLERQGR